MACLSGAPSSWLASPETGYTAGSLLPGLWKLFTGHRHHKRDTIHVGDTIARMKAKKQHKYGIVISARNEKNVIGNLLDIIKKQDYPQELLTVFVVADNCTDNTAEIARKKGAVVYERFDNDHRTKGYALEFLFDKIENDYGRDSFEGYFVFDADNLLKEDFTG